VAELDDGTFLGTHNEYGHWSRIRAIRFRLSAEGQFQIVSPEPLAVATAWLPAADNDENYFGRLAVCGGRAPYHWSIADGKLPDGLGRSK
jgi:hypothetical protein